jgi:hypothetical protein
VILYNWDKATSVELDLSQVIKQGSNFELRDAQNFHGEPIASGCYQGGPLTVSLPAAPRAAQPVGVSEPPTHSGPVFWALVALSKEGCDKGELSSNQ